MAPAPKSAFIVHSTAGQFDILPASALAILGEYVEDGSNHGKRVYRRSSVGGRSEVVLFFWDTRDGKDLSGWWFGDTVGGGQVWARHPTLSTTPPQRGWRCPVDGPVQGHVVCSPKQLAPAFGVKGEDFEDFGEERRGGMGRVQKNGGAQRGGAADRRKRPTSTAQTLVLLSKDKDGAEAPEGAMALLGEYVHHGANHGKKTFRKEGREGADPVWLYYWDSRDGSEFSGWWFGASVGGEEVYARADQHSAMPPVKGWRIPHDGEKSNLSLVLKGHEEDADMSEEERLQKVKGLVSSLESKVDKAVETSQKMLESEGEVFEEALRAVAQMLEARVGELEGAKNAAARHSRAAKKQKASSEVEAELGLLEERLDSALGKALKEAERAQERLQKSELEAAEERDSRVLQAALPGCMESVLRAEIAVEAASSDEAAMRARELLQSAQRQLSAASKAAEAYAPEAQKLAAQELSTLKARCEASEQRLALWEGSGLGIQGLPSEAIDIEAEAEEAPAAAPGPEPEIEKEKAAASATKEPGALELKLELDMSLPEEELLKQMSLPVSSVEAGAKQALETAAVILQGDSDAKGIGLCLELLQEHQESVTTAQARLSLEAAAVKKKGISATGAEAIAALGPRLQVVKAHIVQELALAKRRVAKAHRQAREERDLQAAELAMPLALEAVGQAEDAVEAVVLEAGDMDWRRKQMETAVQFGEDYGEEIQQAMKETQLAADSAQDAISAARTRLDAQIRAARLQPAEQQKAALAEMAPVRRRLIDAQKKLNPYKRVHAEFQQQLEAKGELESLASGVSSVEADLEGVATALEGAGASAVAEEDVGSVEVTLGPLQAELARLLRLLGAKSKSVTGALLERLAAVRERGLRAQARLETLRAQASGERSELLGRLLIQRAKAEAERAETWLPKLREVQEPWGAQEVLPEAKAGPALGAADALVAEAMPSLEAAGNALQEQLLEVRQLPEGLMRLRTAEDLQSFQARVASVALQLTQLRTDTAARRCKLAMSEVVTAVIKAEQEVKKLLQAAEPFGQDDLESAQEEKLKSTGAKVQKCADELRKTLEGARKAVAAKQQDPRCQSSPSFNTQLSRLAKRLETVEATVAGLQRTAKEAVGNKKVLKEQKKGLAELETKVAAVELAALPLGDEQPTAKSEEATAMTVRQAQEALSAYLEHAKVLAGHPHGGLKLAMGRLVEAAGKLSERLEAAKAMVRPQYERAMCHFLLREAQSKLPEAEEAMKAAEAAEGPFLKGIEVLDQKQSAAAIAACEAAAAKAKATLGAVTAFITSRHSEVSSYAVDDESSRAGILGLAGLLQQVERLSQKLSNYQSDTESRKRAAEKQQVGGERASKVSRKS